MKKIISAGKQPVKEFIAVLSEVKKINSSDLMRVAKAYAKNCMEKNA